MRLLLLPAAALLLAAAEPDMALQAIDARQALMKAMRTTLGEFVPMLRGDQPWQAATVARLAGRLRADAARVPALFPAGSETGPVPTMALPAIWSGRVEFEAAARSSEDAAAGLVALAGSGDASALSRQVDAMGQTCIACHRDFRARP